MEEEIRGCQQQIGKQTVKLFIKHPVCCHIVPVYKTPCVLSHTFLLFLLFESFHFRNEDHKCL